MSRITAFEIGKERGRLGRPPMEPRPVRVEGDIAYVPLTRGRAAIIDAADTALVGGRAWSAQIAKGCAYAVRGVTLDSGAVQTIWMHRLIMGARHGEFVDHIDGNGLNNIRANLRFASAAQNARNAKLRRDNASGLKGITQQGSRWEARIHAGGRKFYLGLYETPEDAHAAYCDAAKELHGNFARFS